MKSEKSFIILSIILCLVAMADIAYLVFMITELSAYLVGTAFVNSSSSWVSILAACINGAALVGTIAYWIVRKKSFKR